MADSGASPEVIWDSGTAYDLFTSLFVIHTPGDFGLRPSWAAGIRSRLSPAARELFAAVMPHLGAPISWLYRQEGPKAARDVLDRLEAMQPETILPALAIDPGNPEKCDSLFLEISRRGSWSPSDLESCRAMIGPEHRKMLESRSGSLEAWLDQWSRPQEFGLTYRTGLREYYEVFFREEERRIAADVQAALEHAKARAKELTAAELFEELSQGIRVESHLTHRSLVLVPSYWCTPRILYTDVGPDRQIVLFGARPAQASLIPGDTVPAKLLLALEALSDPTRLSILRTLASQPLTQAEIARKLRLRPPTISHHLKSLRLAGLIAYIGAAKDETRYGTRAQQLAETCDSLKQFLTPPERLDSRQ